ncbi:hypothetical protein HIM_07680 [Hirsutella minnesotensis 3608]|uniref:C2H2-type domain-containing protein n=1 Tax=Hirsutella minnesotensis 3608 TaxID=1043627 RepID=A0A0F7ZYR2_9HYPO|nr:hypothetical protein HIM_07680 [Hirsutella minnesotensis 3608]
MAKRIAAGEVQEALLPKRPRIERDEDPYIVGNDDAESTVSSSSVVDAESPVTAATTPRTKFPSDLKTLACTWPGCPKTFNRPARLRDHLNSHTNSRPFKCPFDGCDKDYIEDKHLKQHVKAVHTHERKYVCQRDGCGKSFVTGTRLKRHQLVHEGADRFRCQDCGQSFRKKETLHKHVRKEHLAMPAHECPDPSCSEAFDSKPRLKRHFDKMHGDIKFWCAVCGLTPGPDGGERRVGFTTELLLQAHLKQDHQNCIFCDYRAASRWELEHHIELHHSGKSVDERKTHECTYNGCGKKFTTNSNLNVHVRNAHEGFRFVCGQVELSGPDLDGWDNAHGCGDKFSAKARLEDHVRFIHLGQARPKLSKPQDDRRDFIDDLSGAARLAKNTIPCPNCDFMFGRYHDLDVHLRRDHGPDALDPALLLAPAPEPPGQQQQQPGVGHNAAPSPVWDADLAHDDIFAARMDYGPPRDDWLDDEANIMLLARDPEQYADSIDPTLGQLDALQDADTFS